MRPVSELGDLAGIRGIGRIVLRDAPDVGVQIVVGLVLSPSRRVHAALEQPGVRGEAGRETRVRREGELLARPLAIQVSLREAVLALVIPGFDAKVRLHDALGSRDLGWQPVSRLDSTFLTTSHY